ncbi:GWT1-domain-containing protein [Fomitopsis serialis]|uniref:GWT1-domain-containing protein n=1 Tax=Fomitopsis serialis TaxID=139415 RepID=UPI002007309F|nr:GWT1-domain-containing protein [Neoantrodia serialis]KAH9921820.1 GWT1-domain-containing protein [Neoantrodia serialis]
MTDYKTSKEAFVSGMTGSSIGHINMISLAALSSIALYSALRTRLPPNRSEHFALEMLTLVLPLLLSITLYAKAPVILNIMLLLPTTLLLLIPRRETGIPLPSTLQSSPSTSPYRGRPRTPDPSGGNSPSTSALIPRLPALTTYRAHMLLLTFLAILAVDFRVFPRMLAKCETYGVSLMDIGVGSFIFSQGIISAVPLIKNPAYLTQPLFPKMVTTARKCLPIFVLGFVRTLSVKGVEYPEHQTEYGTHWNFFITLASIPILEVLLHPVMVRLPISLLGVSVALLQQLVLSHGLTDYVLNAPRTGLISENKEGIVSLSGYLAVHLLGLSTGTLLLPPTPSYFRKRQQELARAPSPRRSAHTHDSDSESDDSTGPRRPGQTTTTAVERRENDKTAIELCSYAVLWWALLGGSKLLGIGNGVSRRLVNLQYILWIAAYNVSFILGYMCLDLAFFASPLSKSTYSPYSKLKVQHDPVMLKKDDRHGHTVEGSAPALLDAINKNGLALFLLANLATGVVNLSMKTMYASDAVAMAVLSAYALAICGVAWVFRNRRLWHF